MGNRGASVGSRGRRAACAALIASAGLGLALPAAGQPGRTPVYGGGASTLVRPANGASEVDALSVAYDAVQSVRALALLGKDRLAAGEAERLATRVVADMAALRWRLERYGRSIGELPPVPAALASRLPPSPVDLPGLAGAPAGEFEARFVDALRSQLDWARARVGAVSGGVESGDLRELLGELQRDAIGHRDGASDLATALPPATPPGEPGTVPATVPAAVPAAAPPATSTP